jgi:uncharacterized protein (UPF0297 family)
MAKRLKGLKKLNKAIAEPLKDRFGISYAEMCNGEFFYSFENNSIGWTLVEKGYDPINQIVGYILSGDPTYITSHKDSRSLIRQLERDELLEELVKEYIGVNDEK